MIGPSEVRMPRDPFVIMLGALLVAPPLFGIVGWKNSGKTTLMVRLIEKFDGLSPKVAAIKRAHHAFDITRDGIRFGTKAAGAGTVIVSSAKRFAVMTETRNRTEPTLKELVGHIDNADIVLIESFKAENHPKLQVRRRQAVGKVPLVPTNPSIVAVAADFQLDEASLPAFTLNDIDGIAEFIFGWLRSQGKSLTTGA